MRITLPNITSKTWATSKDAVPEGHTQITVYDESTGKRIATVFDEEAARAITTQPDCLQALASILYEADNAEDSMEGLIFIRNRTLDTARAALLAAGATIAD